MAEDIIISGCIADIIFQNKENGYSVFTLEVEGQEEITCVGVVAQIHPGEHIKIVGEWIMHSAYGRQFQINIYEKTMPSTKEGMQRYLASGIIKGIGAKTAKKIVDKFGDAAFYVIEEKPERLVEIRGITYEKAVTINRVFGEQHALRNSMLFLQQYGVSPVFAMKIYKRYKDRTVDIVKNNPYRLAEDIFGIGFKMADKMASSAGILPNSDYRIKAGLKYTLNEASSSGHAYLPKEELLEQCAQLLQISDEYIDNCIRELQVDGQLWQEKIKGRDCVFLSVYYYAEIAIAKKLLELSERLEEEEIAPQLITEISQSEEIVLDENQEAAVRQALLQGLLIITGGPGTGKTTTINTIIKILKQCDKKVILAAPTGRAAKRMTEATGLEAQTIHRLLGINFLNEDTKRQTFDKNEDNQIEADVIIIDEMSMVDIMLMHSLLRAIAVGSRLILVGDEDQLPSVGAGNVLKDMIHSERLRVVRLHKIFRQAQESAIVMNAHRINQGEAPILNEKEKDFFFVKRAYVEEVAAAIRDLVTTRIPKFLNKSNTDDIQVLAPMRKSPIGVNHLNIILQEALNPQSPKKKEKEFRGMIYREGDKVMQIKNNYNIVWKVYNTIGKRIEEGIGVFNGDQGRIVSIDEGNELMTILFDENKSVDYDFSQMDELELAYAITIHKSQGSEYPVVIMPIHSGPPMLMSRNLLYTGLTRAKELVVLVGLKETISRMVANNREVNRYSCLAYRIQSLYEFMNFNV